MPSDKQPELVLAMLENGKLFIEVDSLIAWFRSQQDDRQFGPLNRYAAVAIETMVEKGIKNPNMVMNEDTYLAREKKHE